MIEPKQSPRPKHPVDIKHQEVQQHCWNPVTQNMHGMHDVQCVVKEWESLRNANVQRHELNGPFEFMEVVTMVMFLAIILTANVATPPPILRQIRVVPSFFIANTSSILKSSSPLPLDEIQRFFSSPWRSKQSPKPFSLCFRLTRQS